MQVLAKDLIVIKPLINKTAYHFACPACDDEGFEVTHLIGNRASFGPWYCKKCGKGVEGVLHGITVDVKLTGEECKDTLDLLCLPPQADPIYLVVKGVEIRNCTTGKSLTSSKEYLYESHLCPINNFSSAEAIISVDSSDPHGIFEYVASHEITDPEFDGADWSKEEWQSIFPQIK